MTEQSWIEANPALFVTLIVIGVALVGLVSWLSWRQVQISRRSA
jgi:multisubunit Na+/H+ antiporter MnhC subunit